MLLFMLLLLLSATENVITLLTDVWVKLNIDHPGGKGTPLCGLYRDMPLDRYGFLASLSWAGYTASLDSVLIMQGQNLS